MTIKLEAIRTLRGSTKRFLLPLDRIIDFVRAATVDKAGLMSAEDKTTLDSALQNVVEDATPQLGGNLDVNGFDITMPGTETVDGRDVSVDGTKLDGVESGATADQTDAEIETAYNNQVAVVSQAEAECSGGGPGCSTTVRRWTAERVKQAIEAIADVTNIAYKDTSNTFTDNQLVRSSDGGAGEGPVFTLDRASATPADGDTLGNFKFTGRTSTGVFTVFAQIVSILTTALNGSEVGTLRIATREAGSTITRMRIRDGIILGLPTGTFKGDGSLNALAVYDDGTLLTPYVLEQARDGSVDLVSLDSKVLDRFDDEGNFIEELRHEPARKFLARIGTEYDPLDIDKYSQHWKDKTHLTSMPNQEKARSGKDLSTGEWIQRLVETVEIQAVHIDKLNNRLKKLEMV